MTETLAAYSLVAVYSAIAVYALAFIAFVLDLSKRASIAQAAAAEPATATGRAYQGATLVAEKAPPVAAAAGRTRYQRVAFALTVLAWVIHVAAVALRGVRRRPRAVGEHVRVHADRDRDHRRRLPARAVLARPALPRRLRHRLRRSCSATLATVNFYVDVTPLPPPLQSAWLVIHVLVAMLATGFFAIGGGLSIVQLLQARREARQVRGADVPALVPDVGGARDASPTALIIVGFVLWTFTLIAGAIWAERAWGRYWGWDTKEVWTFIIWVVFAGYVHARATRGWRGSRSAWLAIIGFAAVIFNFTIVNLFFAGLHAYSGLK